MSYAFWANVNLSVNAYQQQQLNQSCVSCEYLRNLQKNFCQSMDYWIIFKKHSYTLIIGIYKRYALREKESEHFGNKEDKNMDLRLTDAQKLNIKKALKRGIYQELHDRDYLSDAQLNELISRNT